MNDGADLEAKKTIHQGMSAPAVRIRPIPANPSGQVDRMFAIDGDFVTGPGDVTAIAADAGFQRTEQPAKRLRIFHFNDMHNHVFDIQPDGPAVQRMGQMVRRVRHARATADQGEAVLFLSAGDDHTGTILDELLGWAPSDFILDPGYRAMTAAGVDAAALGNHEFDRGSAKLKQGMAEAAFPLLSANLHASDHLCAGVDYHAGLLVECKGMRVGIVGLTTRVETRVGQPGDPNMAIASPVTVLSNILPVLDHIADVIVVLSHCGYGDGNHASGKAAVSRDIGEGDFALADAASKTATKPTVIVGAHTHTRLNENGVEAANLRSGVLITQAEANGRFLGEISIDLETGSGFDACLHPIQEGEVSDDLVDAAFVEQTITPMMAHVSRRMDEEIGVAEDDSLSWNATRDSRYCSECAMANFMNDALVANLGARNGCEADISLMNGGSILSGLAAGPIAFGDWFKIMPYSDEVFLLRATGRDIRDFLQSNAKRLVRPEERLRTDTGGFIPRGFLHASQDVRYRISLGASAAEASAKDIHLFERPIEDCLDQTFIVATTTYLALGSFGERWNGETLVGGVEGDVPGYDLRQLKRRNSGLVYRDVLVDEIRRAGRVAGTLDGRLVVDP